jgi:hypothetical protein
MSDYSPFDSRGKFLAPTPEQVAALDESKRERLETLRLAALSAEQAEADLKAAQEYVTSCAANLQAAQARKDELAPKITPMQLRQNFIREQQRLRKEAMQ